MFLAQQKIILIAYAIIWSSAFAFTRSEKAPLVPAMYIFGDSILDGGNNVPRPPYGVDLDPSLFPRITNGLTIADYLAEWLGLPLVVPYHNNSVESWNSTKGVNYAFGGSAILEESMPTLDWNFDAQISLFRKKVQGQLYKVFSEEEFINHFRESIFLISFAINDYGRYFENDGKAHPDIEPKVFAKYLLDSLSETLTRLYRLGARKFVVKNIWPMGCMPFYNNNIYICNQTINDVVIHYNNSMPSMLQELAYDLEGFKYSYSDEFFFFQYLKDNTELTGITNIMEKCFDQESGRVCEKRDSYAYFDSIHPTQAANREFASHCFKGTLCSPHNILQLIELGP